MKLDTWFCVIILKSQPVHFPCIIPHNFPCSHWPILEHHLLTSYWRKLLKYCLLLRLWLADAHHLTQDWPLIGHQAPRLASDWLPGAEWPQLSPVSPLPDSGSGASPGVIRALGATHGHRRQGHMCRGAHNLNEWGLPFLNTVTHLFTADWTIHKYLRMLSDKWKDFQEKSIFSSAPGSECPRIIWVSFLSAVSGRWEREPGEYCEGDNNEQGMRMSRDSGE